MSIPISTCLTVKAAKGDEAAFEKLANAMKVNMQYGHWSQYPCDCDPKCDCTDEELAALNDRLAEHIGDVESDLPPGEPGPPGEP
jgi:hypothetical protein